MRELLGLTGQFAAVDELLTGQENLEMFDRLPRWEAPAAWIGGLLVMFVPLCVWRYRRIN